MAAIVDASTIAVAWVAITVRLGSSRSTITPASRLKTVNGMNCANASTPTAIAEWCVSE